MTTEANAKPQKRFVETFTEIEAKVEQLIHRLEDTSQTATQARDEVFGGTEANPTGLKSKLSRLLDDFAEIEKTGVRHIDASEIKADHEALLKLLTEIDTREIKADHEALIEMRTSIATNGEHRVTTLENRQNLFMKVIGVVVFALIGNAIASGWNFLTE